jgi:hypothetical protein
VPSALIVIDAQRFDLRLRIGERRELMDVHTLIAQPALKRFDERVFHRFPGRMKLSCTPRRCAQSSSARDMNSVP